MFDGSWRGRIERGVDPVGERLHRAGVTANALTVSGVVMAAAAAVAIGSGRLRLGFVLVVAAALPDLLDGAVAKAAGPTSRRGAFFDSTADRLSDTLIQSSVAWYLIADDRGLVAMVAVAVLGASWLISYQRAKAESLGFEAKGGIMERAERVILLCVGLLFPALLVPVQWVMLVFTIVTAAQRFAKVWRQATLALGVDDDNH
ncbi:MAG: CDP-alcohol phosphatidyltransferase family protein [Acidimicrobiales bacterium]